MYPYFSLIENITIILRKICHTLAKSNTAWLLEGMLFAIRKYYQEYKITINYVFLNNETLNIISRENNYPKTQYIIKQLCKFKILTHIVSDIYYINPEILSIIYIKESLVNKKTSITIESLEINEAKYKIPDILFPETKMTITYNQFILHTMFQITSKTTMNIFQHMHNMIMYDVITQQYVFSGNDKFIEELAVKTNKSISTIRKTISEFCKVNKFSKIQILYKTNVSGRYIVNKMFTETIKPSIKEISLHFKFSENEISAKEVSIRDYELVESLEEFDAEYDNLE